MIYKFLTALFFSFILLPFGGLLVQGACSSRPVVNNVTLMPARIVNENLLVPVMRPAISRTNLFNNQTDVSWLIIPGDFLLSTGQGEGTATITLPEGVKWTGNDTYGDFGGVSPVGFERVDWGTRMAAGNLGRLQAVSIPFTVRPMSENEIQITFNEAHLVPHEPDPPPTPPNHNNPNFIILPLRADFSEAPAGSLSVRTYVERTGVTHTTVLLVTAAVAGGLGPFTVGPLPAAASEGLVRFNTWSIGEGVAGNFFAATTNTNPMRGITITLGPGERFAFMHHHDFHINFPGRNAQLPVLSSHESGFMWGFNNSRPEGHSVFSSFEHILSLPDSAPERLRFDAFFVNNGPPIVSPITGEILNMTHTHPRAENFNYTFLSHEGSRLNIVLSGADPVIQRITAASLEVVNGNMFLNQRGTTQVNITATAAARGNMPGIPTPPQNVFRFSPGGVTITAMTPTNIVAGRTLVPGFTAAQVFSIDHLPAVTARVNIVENTPNAGFAPWLAPSIMLTDGEGNPLEGVSIAGVQMGGNLITGGTTPLPAAGLGGLNRHFHNASGNAGGGNARWLSIGTPPTLEHGTAPFLTNNSLSFNHLSVSNHERGLAVAFRLSTSPHFSGPVYVTVRSGETDIYTVRVANVTPPVTVNVTPTYLPTAPTGLTPAGDIIIREHAAGALQSGQLLISLAPPTAPGFIHLVRNPLSTITATNGLEISARVVQQESTIIIDIHSRSVDEPGEIHLTGLELLYLLPFVMPVYISIGGSAIQDNTLVQLSVGMGTADYVRYAQDVPAIRYLTIGTQGQPPLAATTPGGITVDLPEDNNGEEASEAEEATPEAPEAPYPELTPPPDLPEHPTVRLVVGSPIVRLGATYHVLMTNLRGELTPILIDRGRVLIPIRGITPLFGGSFDFIWEDGLRAEVTINGITARFVENIPRFYVNNEPQSPMVVAPMVVDGSLYVPVRYFAEVFGMDLARERNEEIEVVYLN